MGNYLDTLKNIAKSKDKKVENLIFILILLVILLVAIGYIFSNTNKPNNTNTNLLGSSDSNKTSGNQNINSSGDPKDEMEKKLGNILSQISGISDVSVMITYSKDSKQTPVFNTKESQKNGETTSEKTVAYNEQNSSKTAIIESVEMPKVEGVIIVAKGAKTVDIKSKVATAISAITNVPVYKVQIFDKD
ncbi:MAG: hypothetical protein N2749_05015 [Clostridia bacterium]|nr:hypothetical protein [Clostridia bacterium]